MRASIWIGLFVGSTVGGMVPALWGGSMLSYSAVLLSAVGALAGWWVAVRIAP